LTKDYTVHRENKINFVGADFKISKKSIGKICALLIKSLLEES
jgi:hypothetical protein